MTSHAPAGPITNENDPFTNKPKGKPRHPKNIGKKLTKADISSPSDFKLVRHHEYINIMILMFKNLKKFEWIERDK